MLPSAGLAEIVEHFWWVEWELERPFRARTLPHPTVHLTFEFPSRAAVLGGPATRAFSRVLKGRGWVFGIKLRPAMASCWWSEAAEWVDRQIGLSRLVDDPSRWRAALFSAHTFTERVERAETLLGALRRERSAEATLVRDLVSSLEHDHTELRVATLARRVGVSARTLERSFRRRLGLTPKQVLQRYRLIDAAERLKAPHATIATVAQALGYFDQAHFVKDFRRTLGVAPSRFARGAEPLTSPAR